MSSEKPRVPKDKAHDLVADIRRERRELEKTYRERALKMYPWICGRCGREFSGKRLRELTVHHRDHNHDNNPPDGSNWELLCLYCHENEHARYKVADSVTNDFSDEDRGPKLTDTPFAGLADLLKQKKD
jgi:HNH endonuclease